MRRFFCSRSSDLLLFGCGSLARSLVEGIVHCCYDEEIKISVATSDLARLDRMVENIKRNSNFSKKRITISGAEVCWSSEDNISNIIGSTNPKVILNTASLQSMWNLHEGTAWAAIIKSHGYGISLPFQFSIIRMVVKAAAVVCPETTILNACYPDIVNWAAAQNGLQIDGGIGNIALVHHAISHCLGMTHDVDFRILAGHPDVALFQKPVAIGSSIPVPIWTDGCRVVNPTVSTIYSLPADIRINKLNGRISAPFIIHLMGKKNLGKTIYHVPGPQGRIGGWPVSLSEGIIKIELPPNVLEDDVTLWQKNRLTGDGLHLLENGQIEFTEAAKDAIKRWSPRLAAGYNVQDTDAVLPEFEQLRDKLSR